MAKTKRHGELSKKQRRQVAETICGAVKDGKRLMDACKAAGVTYSTFARWRREDPEVMALYNDADEVVTQRLVDVALDHAENGTKKGVYYKGKLTETEIEHDHKLLQWAIEARDRRYVQRNKVELMGENGGPIQFTEIKIQFSNDPRDFIDPSDYTPPGDPAADKQAAGDQERQAADDRREADSEG